MKITLLFSSVLAEELSQTPEASPELTKRSWFGSLMSTDRDETYTIIVKEKPLASIKADLVQAFLSVSFLYDIKRDLCASSQLCVVHCSSRDALAWLLGCTKSWKL